MSIDTNPPADPDPADELVRTAVVPGGIRRVTPAEINLSAGPFPGYEIIRRLGDGATGVVYHARQLRLNREVALKVVSAAAVPGSRGGVRFLAEAEAVAAVRHPHVVQVYEYGEHDGRPYLALEYLPGGTLAERLRRAGRLAPVEAAVLVEKLARAVHAAHLQGIVHRDLKPHNVLLDAAGEPKVTDFGLAKRVAADVTASKAVMGTPAYMSPEQARGEARFVGPTADVWALGVILYECLTGTRPFPGEGPEPVLYAILHDDPVSPRRIVPGLPRDLELICLKCLEKEPRFRYETAEGLAADLRRFVNGETVSVRAAGVPERLARWARRKPAQVVAAGLAAAVVAVAGLAAAWFALWKQADHDRHEAVAARTEAEAARRDEAGHRAKAEAAAAATDAANRQLDGKNADLGRANAQLAALHDFSRRFQYGRYVDAAYREWLANDTAQARRALAACPPDLRGWEWHHVHRLTHAELLTVKPHTAAVTVTAFSTNGAKLLTAAADGTVRVTDATTGNAAARFKAGNGAVLAAGFSPDGTAVVSTAGATARVWDAVTGTERLTLPAHAELVTFAVFTPDGRRIVTAGWDGFVRVWDAATGAKEHEFRASERPVMAAALSRDGMKVLTGSLDGTARVSSVRSGNVLTTARNTQRVVTAAGFTPDGALAVTAGDDGTVRVWDAATGDELLIRGGHQPPGSGPVTGGSLACDPAARRVAVLDPGGAAWVFDPKTGADLFAVRFQRGGLRAVAFSADGTRLVTGSPDGTARLWDVSGTVDETVLTGAERAAALAALGPPLAASQVAAKLPAATGAVAAAYNPDRTRLATGHENGDVTVWDAATGAPLFTRPAGTRPADVVGFTRDGATLIVGNRAGRVVAWDSAPVGTVPTAPAPRPVR